MTGKQARYRPFVALLVANMVSDLGNNFTFVVVPWFVLQATGSPTKTGVTLATGTLPILLAGLLGGALVDRLGYRRSSVVADLGSGLAVALIPFLSLTIGLAFWQLLVLVFLRGLLNDPGDAARQSLILSLADEADMPLERANSLVQTVHRMALLCGPPIAGVLIATLGAVNVFWLDAASFALSAAIIAVMVPHVVTAGSRTTKRSYGAEIMEGLRTLGRDRLLIWLVVTFALGSLLSEPIYVVAFPVYAREAYGSAVDLGLMYSALAAGSLAGLLTYALVGPRLPRRGILIAGFLVRAASFWVLVPMPPLPIVLAAIFVNAVCFEPINPLTDSIIQARVPAGRHGRVFGAINALAGGTLPLGTLIGGLFLGGFGLTSSLVAIAIASLAQACSLPVIPVLKAMDDAPAMVTKIAANDP